MLPCCPATRCGSQPVISLAQAIPEGSLTAVAAGEQVVPASELAAAMKQIKELQRLLGKKTMENELLKEAVEYGRAKKVDSARALIARGWGVSLVSRCLRVSRAQLHVILRRTDDWKYRGKSTSLLFRKDFSGSKQRSMPD